VTAIYFLIGLIAYGWPVLLAMFMVWWAAWCFR
jgi:hypothetical protein